MKIKDSQIFWLVGITAAILILLPYLGLVPKFVISDSDFISDGTLTLLSSTTVNDSITFSWIQDVNNTMENSSIFYTVGNSTSILTEIPDLEGTHTIIKYQIISDGTTATLYKWHTIYTKEIQNVTVYQNVTLDVTSAQICSGLGGTYSNVTCTCPNGNKWYDNSTSKICGVVTVTTTVNVEPSFWMKYGAPSIVFVVMGLIIIYLIYKRTR